VFASFHFHFALGVYWSLLANAVTYGAIKVTAHDKMFVVPEGKLHGLPFTYVVKVVSLGCDKVEDVAPYVARPSQAARHWQEKWLVKGCGKQYPVDIDFKEDGAGPIGRSRIDGEEKM
jgi:hypothetical protein